MTNEEKLDILVKALEKIIVGTNKTSFAYYVAKEALERIK